MITPLMRVPLATNGSHLSTSHFFIFFSPLSSSSARREGGACRTARRAPRRRPRCVAPGGLRPAPRRRPRGPRRTLSSSSIPLLLVRPDPVTLGSRPAAEVRAAASWSGSSCPGRERRTEARARTEPSWVRSVHHFSEDGANPHLGGIFPSGANPTLPSSIQTAARTGPLRPGSFRSPTKHTVSQHIFIGYGEYND